MNVNISYYKKCNVYLFSELEKIQESQLIEWYDLLSDDRLKKVKNYRFYRDRRNSVVAYLLLRLGIFNETGNNTILEFDYNKYGKPFLPNNDIKFSISHCKNAVLCAVSADNVGCDVQEYEPALHTAMPSLISEEEAEFLSNAEKKEKILLKLWTLKEAYGKYCGVGLNYDTRSISFSSLLNGSKQFKFNEKYMYLESLPDFTATVISDCAVDIRVITYEQLEKFVQECRFE